MKLIGIVGRVYKNIDDKGIIQTHDAVRRTIMRYNDVTCITLLPTEDIDYFENTDGSDNVNTNKLDFILDKCDGFIVPGGSFAYNFDEYVINYAIKNDKPLLCICLGFQAICSLFAKERTTFDMSIDSHLPNHYGPADEYQHKVIIKDNTLLKDIIKENEIPVNSVHHCIIKHDLKELVISAISDDGIIEAVEYPNKKFIIGLQWHPECLSDDYSKRIFDKYMNTL